MKCICAQRGCEFEADTAPEDCPVCNNPFIDIAELGDVDELEVAWSEYTIAELREYADAWELEGWTTRSTKAELIALLEAAEAEAAEDDDA